MLMMTFYSAVKNSFTCLVLQINLQQIFFVRFDLQSSLDFLELSLTRREIKDKGKSWLKEKVWTTASIVPVWIPKNLTLNQISARKQKHN